MLTTISTRLWAALAAFGAALALLGAAVLKGRRDATRDAALRAAESEQRARRAGDAAAADAERDGAANRLRDGRF